MRPLPALAFLQPTMLGAAAVRGHEDLGIAGGFGPESGRKSARGVVGKLMQRRPIIIAERPAMMQRSVAAAYPDLGLLLVIPVDHADRAVAIDLGEQRHLRLRRGGRLDWRALADSVQANRHIAVIHKFPAAALIIIGGGAAGAGLIAPDARLRGVKPPAKEANMAGAGIGVSGEVQRVAGAQVVVADNMGVPAIPRPAREAIGRIARRRKSPNRRDIARAIRAIAISARVWIAIHGAGAIPAPGSLRIVDLLVHPTLGMIQNLTARRRCLRDRAHRQ